MIRPMQKDSGKSYWPVPALFILTILFFWRAIFNNEIFQYRDLFYFHYPLRYYWANLIHSGEMPYLNTAVNLGQPILANPNYATFYPPTWLYVLLPFDVAWNLLFIIHVLWAALGMYWLVRILKCGELAALAAAITFAFSGTFLSCLNYSNMAIAGSWLPWVAGSTIQAYFGGGKWSHGAIIMLALQFLAGEPTITVITSLLVGIGWLIGLQKATDRSKILFRGIWILTLAALLICIQLIPALMWLPYSARGVGLDPRKSALFWSMHPARLVEIIVPNYYGNVMSSLVKDFWGGSFSDTGYPYIFRFYCGLIPLLIAPFAWNVRHGKIAIAISVAGLILAFGRFLPGFEASYSMIPFFQFIRYPEKFLIVYTFGLSLATAIGLHLWLEKVNLRYLSVVSAVLISLLILFLNFHLPEGIKEVQRMQQLKAVLNAFLYSVASFFVLLLCSRKNLIPVFRLVLPIFLVLNLAPYTIDIAETEPKNDVHAANQVLKTFPELNRTPLLNLAEEETDLIFASEGDPRILLRQCLYPYSALPLGVRYGATNDIDRMGSRKSWNRQLIIRKKFRHLEAIELLRRSGINFVLSLTPINIPQLRLKGNVAVSNGTNQVFAYELNPPAKSEIWFEDDNSKLKWNELSRNHLLIQIESQDGGDLFIARNSIPGWRSTLDQKGITVGETLDGLIVLKIPSGKHLVDLKFVPPGFYAGSAISLVTLIVFFVTLATVKDTNAIREIAEPTTKDAGM
jgi:hypothetical protein